MQLLRKVFREIFYSDSKREELKTKEKLEKEIYQFVLNKPTFSGTSVKYGESLKYENVGLISDVLLKLVIESKMEMRGIEIIHGYDGSPVIFGIYGVKSELNQFQITI